MAANDNGITPPRDTQEIPTNDSSTAPSHLEDLHGLALRAHSGTSHFPEKRADGIVREYREHMQAVEQEFSQWRTDDNAADLDADLAAYRARYTELLRTYLHSHSNVVSAFIAGPANFPTRQMQKRSQWADKHRDRWLEFSRSRLEKLRRKYDPRRIARAPISSDDPDAVAKLRAKIEKAEALQELMKAANKVVRKKKLSDEEKAAELVELGLSQDQAQKLLTPDCMGNTGFPGYRLSNNSANIRSMKKRVARLEQAAQDTTTETEFGEVRVVDNVKANRVQVIFPGKPSAEIRAKLKSNGFHWAPSWDGKPWQRKRSDWALQVAKEIAAETEPEKCRPGRA